MNCYIKDVKLYYTFLDLIKTDIKQLETTEKQINEVKTEIQQVKKKHAGINFALRAAAFTAGCFIILRMAYSVEPKDFNYVLLAPVFGCLIELIFAFQYSRKEKKAVLKGLEKSLSSLEEEKREYENSILNTDAVRQKKLKYLTEEPGKYVNNFLCLEYILKNDKNDDTVINFDSRYEEFISRYEKIDEYPELAELKERIQQEETNSQYTELIIKNIKERRNEKNNDSDNNTEKG